MDWTQNPDVALYFANAERDDDVPGAVFIADSTAMGLILHCDMKVDCMLDLYEDAISSNKAPGCPIIFCPREQLLQHRPKNQDAIYFAQMDLRFDLTELWTRMMNGRQDGELLFIKLRLPPGSSMECNDWLERKGITKSFLFPDEE